MDSKWLLYMEGESSYDLQLWSAKFYFYFLCYDYYHLQHLFVLRNKVSLQWLLLLHKIQK